MGKIYKANARIKHHTITGQGLTFSIPTNDDFTTTATSSNGLLWSKTDLLPSEFGINNDDKVLSLRIDNEIRQIDCWTNPIVKTFSTTGSGTYSIADIPITQKYANGEWALNLVNFRVSVTTTQAGNSTASPFNPLKWDYFLLDTGIINWKPSGGSYSFASTGNWSASTLSVGEFSTFFGWSISTQDSASGSTASIRINQTGGTVRNCVATVQWKKTLL